MNILKLTSADLEQVAMENARALGPVSDDVYRDTGYGAWSDLEQTVDAANLARAEFAATVGNEQLPFPKEVAKKAGELICGDCLQVAPCIHITFGPKGKPRIQG